MIRFDYEHGCWKCGILDDLLKGHLLCNVKRNTRTRGEQKPCPITAEEIESFYYNWGMLITFWKFNQSFIQLNFFFFK